MFEIYNRKGSNDTFDDHHGQITQKDQPSRNYEVNNYIEYNNLF